MERSLKTEAGRQLRMLDSAIASGDRKEAARRLDDLEREPVYHELFLDARFWHAASIINLMNDKLADASHCHAQTYGELMHHYDDAMQVRYARHLFRHYLRTRNTSGALRVLEELADMPGIDAGWMMMAHGRVLHAQLKNRAFITRGTRSKLVEEILEQYDQADQYWLSHPPGEHGQRWPVNCLIARFDALLELPHHSASHELIQLEQMLVGIDGSLRGRLRRMRRVRRWLG